MTNKQKIKCLFGFHDYTRQLSKVPKLMLCKHCERSGYCEFPDGFEEWYEFDEKGNLVHSKGSDGDKVWYNEKGNIIHRKFSDMDEVWYEYDEKGNLVHRKWSDGLEVWFDEEGKYYKKVEEALK